MIAVNLAEDRALRYFQNAGLLEISHDITVACVNSPQNCTLSGSEDVVTRIKERLEQDGIFAQVLQTGIAYHSPAMHAISSEYLRLMGSLESGTISSKGVETTMTSSITGKPVSPSLLSNAKYWVDNLVSPVRFTEALKTMVSQAPLPFSDVLEIGPHSTLRRPIQDTLNEEHSTGPIGYISVLNKNKPAFVALLECVGHLFSRGYSISVCAANQLARTEADEPKPFLADCPEYPFDHSRQYWAESRISRNYRLREPVHGGLLGARADDWNPLQPRWRNFLSAESPR